MTNKATQINQDSGNTEYYTPIEIVNAARATMDGVINLDPASSTKANDSVGAETFYAENDNSLDLEWYGNVWMNHPFSRANNKAFIDKLVQSYQHGQVIQACCITFAATSEKWFRPLLAYPQCFLHGRTNYYLPDGTQKKGVTKGSVVTYMGDNVDEFKKQFSRLGTVK